MNHSQNPQRVARIRHVAFPRSLAPGILVLLGLSLATQLPAQAQENPAELECLRGFLTTGADDLTLGEMRERCALPFEAPPANVVEARIAAEREAAEQPFSLLAHQPNYLLLGAWNQRGWDPSAFQEAEMNPDYSLDDIEMQFQLSFKVPLAVNLFDGHMDVYAAYTNRSFWQAYNEEWSQPFRETNHEPELWAQWHNDWQLFGVTNVLNRVGYVHQSNGRSEPLSRGWDRLYADIVLEKQGFVLSLKPWIWLNDDSDTDNPDIDEYMGHGELRAAWAHDGRELTLMVRNQIESDFERGAVELGWAFPLFGYPYIKGYAQWFYGYGESLIDYDRRVNRIGLGVSFTNLLE